MDDHPPEEKPSRRGGERRFRLWLGRGCGGRARGIGTGDPVGDRLRRNRQGSADRGNKREAAPQSGIPALRYLSRMRAQPLSGGSAQADTATPPGLALRISR